MHLPPSFLSLCVTCLCLRSTDAPVADPSFQQREQGPPQRGPQGPIRAPQAPQLYESYYQVGCLHVTLTTNTNTLSPPPALTVK